MRARDSSAPHNNHDPQMIQLIGEVTNPRAVVGEDMKCNGEAKSGRDGQIVQGYMAATSAARLFALMPADANLGLSRRNRTKSWRNLTAPMRCDHVFTKCNNSIRMIGRESGCSKITCFVVEAEGTAK